MAYRYSKQLRNEALSPPPDPMDAANLGFTPEEGGYADTPAEQDPGLRAAAARELFAEPTAIPENRAWHEESAVGLLARVLPGEDTWLESSVENLGARAGELILGFPELAGSVGEAAGVFQPGATKEFLDKKRTGIMGGVGGASIREQVESVFGSRELINERYPTMTWESLKEDWKSDETGWARNAYNIAELAVTQGPASMADAFLAVKKPLTYITTRTGEMTQDRAEGTGEEIGFGDIALNAIVATGIQQMEKLGFDTIMLNNPAVKGVIEKASSNLTSRLLGGGIGAMTEGGTEYVQEYIEALTAGVKDDLSNLGEVMDAAAIDSLAGAIVGGGMGATLGGYNAPTVNVDPGPAPDEAAAVAETNPPMGQDPELDLGIPETGMPSPQFNDRPPAEEPPEEVPEGQLELPLDGPPEQQLELPLQQPTPEAEPAPEDTGSAMELQPGVLDDGQQDVVARPDEPIPLPEDLDPDAAMADIRTQELRLQQDAEMGAELRETGFGKLVKQAVEGKASVRQVEELAKKNETLQEKLDRQQKRVKDAKTNAPGQVMLDLFDNIARIINAKADRTEDMVRDAIEARNPKLKTTREQLANQLRLQTDAIQGLTKLVEDSVRGVTSDVSGPDAVAGAISRAAPTLRALGFDTQPLSEAATPVEARKALDTLAQQAKNEVIALRNTGVNLNLPPRISMDRNLAGQIDPKTREIRAVRAETERQGQAQGKSTVPDMTPEDLYADTETDEEGNVRKKFRGPKDSPEDIERREAIRERDRTVERQKFGEITNYERPGPQYEDAPDVKVGTDTRSKTGEESARIADNIVDRKKARVEARKELTAITNRMDKMAKPLPKDVKKKAQLEADIERLTKRIQEDEDTLAELTNQTTVSAKELAAREGRERAPGNSDKIRRENLRKARRSEVAERDLGTSLVVQAERLAAAERSAGQRRQDNITREEERRAKEAAAEAKKAAKLEGEPEESGYGEAEASEVQKKASKGSTSGTVKKTPAGVGKDRVKEAGKVFQKYNRAGKKGAKQNVSASTIFERAKDAKNRTLEARGLGSVLVFNENFRDPRKALFWVRGAYPKRIIKRGKDGRIKSVKRAVPHSPGDPAPYSFLKKRTYYYPEDIVMVRGNRVHTMEKGDGMGGPKPVYAQLKEQDLTTAPKEMDSLLEFLGTINFEWEGEPDELALAQYLMNKAPASKASKRTKEREVLDPKQTLDDMVDESEIVEDMYDDFVLDDDVDVYDLVEMLSRTLPGEEEIETDPNAETETPEALGEQIRRLESQIPAAKLELPAIEQLARETQVEDGVMSVEAHAAWPFVGPDAEFEVLLTGEELTDAAEVIDYDFDPADPDGSMVAAIVDQAQTVIENRETQLKELRRRLEEANERRNSGEAGKSKKPPRKPKAEGPDDLSPADSPSEDDKARAARRANPDRVPGLEPVDPDRRVAVDLYEGLPGRAKHSSSAIQRTKSLVFRGDDGRPNLSKEQVIGIAAGFDSWMRAMANGYGGFLNLDATGFGKARQVSGVAKLIADEEAKAGRNRPIALFFPGGGYRWKMVTDKKTKIRRRGITNQLGDNIVKDMQSLGIDPEAKYSDGTPMFEFRPYQSLGGIEEKNYAAVIADEAHEVKGTGKHGVGFDNLKTPWRAFFTATPTDKPGQELYYLKHILRKKNETLDEAVVRIATKRLGLRLSKNNKGNDVYEAYSESQGAMDNYLRGLRSLLDPIVRSNDVVSRTLGRLSKNYINEVPDTKFDQGAVELYNELLARGKNPLSNEMLRLVEHMKIPYMVKRTKKRVEQDKNKVIAVFMHTNPSTSADLKGTPYAEPAIDRYYREVQKAGIPIGKLAGSKNENADDKVVKDFQDEWGPTRALAISTSRGSTGLNLNDTNGQEPRHMLIAMVNYQGESFMQLLGRHDRNNNRSVPYTEWVKANNDTDRELRVILDRKKRLQETITGERMLAEENPENYEQPINSLPGFLTRTRQARQIKDVVDLAVIDQIQNGKNDAKSLVHTVAMGSKDPDLAALASDLLRLREGWDSVSVRMMRDGEMPEAQGVYYPRNGEIAISDEPAAAQTLLHELVHHFTNNSLERNPAAKRQLTTIMEAMVRANPRVMDNFSNAFQNHYEFLAEAFSDPAFQYELHRTNIGGGKKLSMFQRFMRWVQQLLGVTPEGYNALERIVDLDLFRTSQNDMYSELPLHQLETPRMQFRKRNRMAKQLEAWDKKTKLGGAARGYLDKARKGMIWTMTYDQIVDTFKYLTVRPVEMGRTGNILEDMVENQEDISAQASKNNDNYRRNVIDPIRKFATTDGKKMMKVKMREGGPVENMTQLEYLSHIMNISGYAGVHFGRPKTDKANAMLHKNKKGQVPRAEAQAAWDVHHSQVQRAEFKEAMKVYNDLARFFESNREQKRRVIAGSYLDSLTPNASDSWTTRTLPEINAQLKRLKSLTTDEMKERGVTKDALDEIENMLQPGRVPGAYFPLKRYGDYVVTIDGSFEYTSDEERDRILRQHPNAKDKDGRIIVKSVARFETRGEAERFAESKREQYQDVEEIRVRDLELKYASNEEIMGSTSFSALAQNFNNQVRDKVDDSKQRETMQRLFAQAMLDMMPETSAANAMRERQGIDGASLDIQRVLHQYGTSQGYLMANLQYSRRQNQLAQDLREMSGYLKGNEQIKLEQVRQALMSRNNVSAKGPMDLGKVGQTLSDVGFLYYLVGFSYNIVNATQPLMVTTPYLAARYGGKKTTDAMINAYKTVGKAPVNELIRNRGSLKQLAEFKNIFSKEGIKELNRDDMDVLHGPNGILASLGDGEQAEGRRSMLEALADEGHIEASLAMDMSRKAERAHVDENGKAIPVGAWEYLTDWMRIFPHITEVMNRSVTAVAAYDLEYAKTKDQMKAIAAARTAVKQTQFVYQNWNKPPAFQSDVGRTALMFKQHVQHMYYYMLRNVAVSLNGASPEERATARKAVTYFVAMHVAMAGAVGGTPELVKWIIHAAYMLFGDEDEPFEYDRMVRNAMFDLFGGEEGFGNIGATLASQGLPGFLGMDLSGRVGIDSMLMFEAPDMSTTDSFLADTLRIAGGPMIGLAERSVGVKQAYQRGDYYRLVEQLSPKVIRDPVKALRYNNQGYKDLSGKTYRDSEDVSWWEFGQKALGFAPKAEGETYQSRAVGQTRQRMDGKKRNLYTRFYSADTKEDRQKVIEDIREWNKANPDFAITRSNLIRSVKQRRRQELLTEKGVYTPTNQRGWVREQQRSY